MLFLPAAANASSCHYRSPHCLAHQLSRSPACEESSCHMPTRHATTYANTNITNDHKSATPRGCMVRLDRQMACTSAYWALSCLPRCGFNEKANHLQVLRAGGKHSPSECKTQRDESTHLDSASASHHGAKTGGVLHVTCSAPPGLHIAAPTDPHHVRASAVQRPPHRLQTTRLKTNLDKVVLRIS